MKKRKPKDWLYIKYKKEHQDQTEVKKAAEELGVQEEKVVVKKLSFSAKALEIISDIFYWSFRILLCLIVFGLISLALTVLINSQLRDYVFQAFK